MKNHSKCASELNDAADGVGKVTKGLYVACSKLCIQLLEKLDLPERNNPGEVNYTGQTSRSSHRRLKCDVINAGCRCRRRRLPFPTLSRFSLSLSLSLSLQHRLDHTPEENLGRTVWNEKEHHFPRVNVKE
jgi:hypothetical protein